MVSSDRETSLLPWSRDVIMTVGARRGRTFVTSRRRSLQRPRHGHRVLDPHRARGPRGGVAVHADLDALGAPLTESETLVEEPVTNVDVVAKLSSLVAIAPSTGPVLLTLVSIAIAVRSSEQRTRLPPWMPGCLARR